MKTVNWFKFKAAFYVAVASRNVKDEEKLMHLLGLLEGAPLKIAHRVAGDEYTEEAYVQVWNALETAYGGEVRKRHRLFEELRTWPKLTEFTAQNTLELTALISSIIRIYTAEGGELDATGAVNVTVQQLLPRHEAKRYFTWLHRENEPNDLYTLYDFLETERAALENAAILAQPTMGRSMPTFDPDPDETQGGELLVRGEGSAGGLGLAATTGDPKPKPALKTKPCEMCEEPHRLWTCPNFIASTIPVRFKFVTEKRMCYHCLNGGHGSRDCTFKRDIKCNIDGCTRYHHHLLHQPKESGLISIERYYSDFEAAELANATRDLPSDTGSSMITSETVLFTKGDQYDAIRTAPAYIISPFGHKERVWIALDSCSTSTYIDADVAKKLNLKIEEAAIDRHIGVLQSSVNIVSDRVSFLVQTLDGKARYPIQAFTVKNLVQGTPVVDWQKVAEEYPHLQSATIPKADPKDRVRILLGIDYNHLMIANHNLQGRHLEPTAEHCKLGWSFSGRVKREHVINREIDSCNFLMSFASHQDRRQGDPPGQNHRAQFY